MVRFLGRRAVSGAISGMFVVLIFVAAVSALLAYNTSLDRYNQAVSERNRMEWERLNEKVVISTAERLGDGTLNAAIQNVGAVTAHLVGLWLSAYDGNSEPKWQHQYSIDVWISPGETKYNFGQSNYTYTLIKPGQSALTLSSIYLPNASWTYTIKIITERGNAAIYQLTPPSPSVTGGGGGGGYPLIIVADHYNFQYTAGTMTSFKSAYVKPKGTERTLYRILLNNTTNRRIILYKNSTMLQIQGAVGAVTERYIVSNQSTSWPDNLKPFSSQVMNPGSSQYIYFAAKTPGGNQWQDEPNKSDYYLVGFMIWFMYEGETEVRSISLPSIVQELQ
jgi:hypothetical protein